MPLPYENATSGSRTISQIEKILRGFGCSKIGNMMDHDAGELLIQFEYRGRQVTVRASVHGYAAAWLKKHPPRLTYGKEHEKQRRRAREIAELAVYSIVRDWIKGQVTAVETGVLSFEGAFLGQILLGTGRSVLETIRDQNLLPAPAPEDNVRKIA